MTIPENIFKKINGFPVPSFTKFLNLAKLNPHFRILLFLTDFFDRETD